MKSVRAVTYVSPESSGASSTTASPVFYGTGYGVVLLVGRTVETGMGKESDRTSLCFAHMKHAGGRWDTREGGRAARG